MRPLFGLTKQGHPFPRQALADTAVSGLVAVSLCVSRRFEVEGVGGNTNLTLRPTIHLLLNCSFSLRGWDSDQTAQAFLTSPAKDVPDGDFERRVASVVFRAEPSKSPKLERVVTHIVPMDNMQGGQEDQPDTTSDADQPARLPARMPLTETAWTIDWLASIMKANDISRLRVKVSVPSQEAFVTSLRKRVSRYYKLRADFIRMQQMPHIESRIEDPAKLAAVQERVESGAAAEGDFVTQDQVEANQKALRDCATGIQSLLDSYCAVTAEIPLHDLPKRAVPMLETIVFGYTSKVKDNSPVTEEMVSELMAYIAKDLNFAANKVADRAEA